MPESDDQDADEVDRDGYDAVQSPEMEGTGEAIGYCSDCRAELTANMVVLEGPACRVCGSVPWLSLEGWELVHSPYCTLTMLRREKERGNWEVDDAPVA